MTKAKRSAIERWVQERDDELLYAPDQPSCGQGPLLFDVTRFGPPPETLVPTLNPKPYERTVTWASPGFPPKQDGP